MSGADIRNKIPTAPTPIGSLGNLLSSVAPPTELPNFVTLTPTAPESPSPEGVVPNIVPGPPPQSQLPPGLQDNAQQQPKSEVAPQTPENFSPAIPLSKGQPTLPISSPEDSQTTHTPESQPDFTPEMDKIGDIMPGSGLFTWMKGAVASGGILQRVAEKAKSSVDSMITTLDPQMKEYLRSGGDLYVIVASEIEAEESAVREAFQTVFGKANVIGCRCPINLTTAPLVGYAVAYAEAKQRIAHVRSTNSRLSNNIPIVAIQSFVHEAVTERWYELSVLVLVQPSLGIELQVQSQGVAVSAMTGEAAVAAADERPANRVTEPEFKTESVQVPYAQWHEESTGVPRREVLLLAARSLAGSYKRALSLLAADT